MKKYLIITAVVATIGVLGAVAYAGSKINIQIGTDDIEYKNEVYNINDMIYVPLRETFENLSIPVEWDEEKNTAHVFTQYKTVKSSENSKYNENGIIPDEETAYKIGKIILETYTGKEMEYESDEGTYYLSVTYRELDNSWRVSQELKYAVGGGDGTGTYSPTVALNKNTGEVMYINTYSVFDELYE